MGFLALTRPADAISLCGTPPVDCYTYQCVSGDWVTVGYKVAGTSCKDATHPDAKCDGAGLCTLGVDTSVPTPGATSLALFSSSSNSDAKGDILRPWNASGTLGLYTALSTGTAFVQGMRSYTMNVPSVALAYLPADVDGDGQTDLVQFFDSSGNLGYRVFRSPNYPLSASSTNAGAFNTPLAWLTGDVNGDAKTDIIEPWDNAGTLGLNLFASTGAGFVKSFTTGNAGQPSAALAFLAGDVNGDGRTDLIQLVKNTGLTGSPLEIVVYASNGTGLVQSWINQNTDQGSSALAWLTGDVNGDGKIDIIQPWANGTALGLIDWVSNGTGFALSFASSNFYSSSAALAWLTGDVDGDGKTDLIQPWNSGNSLAINVFKSNGSGHALACSTTFSGASVSAVAWLTADVDGDGATDVIQLWNNNGVLAATVWLSDGAACYRLGWTTSSL
jgi:hypothetical protein